MDAPTYPGRMPGQGEPSWRETTLYSVGGWFSTDDGEEVVAYSYGGYFRLDHETGRIEGEFIDTLGPSKVIGVLLPEGILGFTKKYQPPILHGASRWPIRFNLTLVNNNEYRGNFVVDAPGTNKGDVYCRINVAVENAFGLVIGPPIAF